MILSLFKRKTPKLPSGYLKLISDDAITIIDQLQKAGHKAYLVGGCVRDILLKRPSKDFDIATSAKPEEVKRIIARSQIIGRRFKIVVARRRIKKDQDLKKELFPVIHLRPELEEFQITTYRSQPQWDEELGKMNENVYGSAKEDASRRDFTINALFLDPITSKIVDYVGGNQDIKEKLIRVIGDPKERFKEDPIRILRALRFAKRNQLEFESKTHKALIEQIPCLKDAKKERVREEILKIWREGVPGETFQAMMDLGLWQYISPLYARHLEQNPKAFKTLIKVAKAVAQCPWNNYRLSSPFFFLMASDIFSSTAKKGKPLISELFAKLNVSKKEFEDIEIINDHINRLSKGQNKNARVFRRHPRAYDQLSQSFYVIKILGDAGNSEMKALWKSWQDAWQEYKLSSASLFRSPRPTRPRRPRRRTRSKG